jgi:hypothetical protein
MSCQEIRVDKHAFIEFIIFFYGFMFVKKICNMNTFCFIKKEKKLTQL